ncbi:uncharacterized protein si:ch211-199g17.2 [Amphiprion ocellaris]|uniref:uncharacterized protein si:ch211-199g17.2 n=1 Tax=Amphiprion ocellaris TaxID=80972 RepID=UPI000C3039DB|nr:uncharacterized protein si:ch211-199g17.2 [Amphiprion ocellaris]XP_023140937.1 uncharacterized protein si:ch211-199g17.2 [Amphiprion ocellaris]
MPPGVSNKSQLLESLKDYLNNKNRLQPIIGLGSIIECVKVGPQNRDSFYLCEVCICQLNKADMRNHILGSLHRFNYIKTWHPYLLSEWQENSDLSKLAWPLMEKAKVLERKEGPGHVQLLEVEDAVYQRMATHREKDAVALINSLKNRQSEPESTSLHYPVQSQRTVLLAQSQRGMSKKSLKADKKSYKTAQSEQKSLPMMQAKPPVKPEVWIENISTSQLNDTQTSPESISEKSRNFLDDYTGTKPLIGLSCVVEYRSEDGCSYCFLCHCCRIKSDKKDVTVHLTSSSHLLNYLMESCPEQVVGMTADIRDDHQLLCSLAMKVEQKEGRGELKVVNAPESFCMQLIGKSYHWCIKMLSSGWTHANIQKKRAGVRGSTVNKTSGRDVSEKYHAVLPKRAKRQTTKTKNRKMPNTVFSVSLPLTKGSILLERSSFSMDSLPVCFASPSSDEYLRLSPESQIMGSEFYDCDNGSFEVNDVECPTMCKTSQLQQNHYGGDANAGQYIPEKPLSVTLLQDAEGYANNGVYVLQSEDVTGAKDDEMYGEGAYNRQHGSQESSSQTFFKKSRNENRQTHNGLLPAVSHTMTWPPYHSSYRQEVGGAEQWHNSTSQSQAGTRVEGFGEENHKDMSFDALQHYYRQHQYTTADTGLHYNTAPVTGSVGHHYLSGEPVAYSNAAQTNLQTPLGDCLAYNGSIPSQAGVQFPDSKPRSSQTYTEFTTEHFQTAAQSYTQSTAYQAYQSGQVDQGLTSNHSTGTWTNPDPHYAYPASICGGAGVQCYHPTWPSSVLRGPLRS